MGELYFDLKESAWKLIADIRDRISDALMWCRDAYLHTPTFRATIDSVLLLGVLLLGGHLVNHPTGLRMMYILPIWLAAKRGGRIAGYINVGATTAAITYIDYASRKYQPTEVAINSVLNLLVLVGLMAFIEHFESRLRKYANMAKRDALTGALNRLGLDEYVPQAIERAISGSNPLTIAMIDCDKFKELNDEHGHEYGDHVLKTLARLLRRYSQGGVVGRNGGDEFVLVLPGRTPSDARHILNKVNWKFREATVLGDRCASFSYGISRIGPDGMTLRDLVVAADKDMYIQKAARNGSAIVQSPNHSRLMA